MKRMRYFLTYLQNLIQTIDQVANVTNQLFIVFGIYNYLLNYCMNEYSNYRKPNQSTSNHFSARDYFKDNLRVLRKNLLFCSGLPLHLTQQQIKSEQYFGKYGKVIKVTQLRNIRQMSTYVTYSDPYEASLAIIATNNYELDRYNKLASIYGTIKYCKYFLKKIECKNLPNCNYLHVFDKKNEIYINNQLPDEVFEEHYNIALRLLKQVNIDQMIKEKRYVPNKTGDLLPCPIQTLNKIKKLRRQSYSSDTESECSSNSQSVSKSSSRYSSKQSSEQQTYQTIVSQNLQLSDQQKEDFPKLQVLENEKKVEKQNEKTKEKQEDKQSLQIKLIRKLVRSSRSKLTDWTQNQISKEQQEQINFFHKQLSQLNQLRQLCESNILKQKNKEQERLKFLLIKNIHHKKHHHTHGQKHTHCHQKNTCEKHHQIKNHEPTTK